MITVSIQAEGKYNTRDLTRQLISWFGIPVQVNFDEGFGIFRYDVTNLLFAIDYVALHKELALSNPEGNFSIKIREDDQVFVALPDGIIQKVIDDNIFL